MKPSQIAPFIMVVLLIGVAYVAHSDFEYTKKLKSGEITLECVTKENGVFIVDPKRITNFDMETQTVYFDNGYATSCTAVQ
jgi:hypothetical protein